MAQAIAEVDDQPDGKPPHHQNLGIDVQTPEDHRREERGDGWQNWIPRHLELGFRQVLPLPWAQGVNPQGDEDEGHQGPRRNQRCQEGEREDGAQDHGQDGDQPEGVIWHVPPINHPEGLRQQAVPPEGID